MKKLIIRCTLWTVMICLVLMLSGCIFGTVNYNEYGPEYITHWKGTDGLIEFENNNRIGMYEGGVYGRGVYEGTYYTNGNKYQVFICVDYMVCDARTDDMTLDYIFAGKAEYNFLTKEYTVFVEQVNNELSVYKPGDTIVFYQVD